MWTEQTFGVLQVLMQYFILAVFILSDDPGPGHWHFLKEGRLLESIFFSPNRWVVSSLGHNYYLIKIVLILWGIPKYDGVSILCTSCIACVYVKAQQSNFRLREKAYFQHFYGDRLMILVGKSRGVFNRRGRRIE